MGRRHGRSGGRIIRASILTIAFCLAAIPAQAFTATVASVHDGDTIHVTTLSGGDIKIRLADLDAPEIDQPFGQRSKRALCDLICGKTVEIEVRGLDPYGRTIGVINAPFNANEQMVREGMAWTYTQYNLDPAMPGLEEQAKAGLLGLWSGSDPEPPWEWRHHH